MAQMVLIFFKGNALLVMEAKKDQNYMLVKKVELLKDYGGWPIK